MAGRERDWMDYAQLGSSLAQNAQLSSIGDQLAALKQAESQKQFAEFEVSVIRQILFRIEDRIRSFTKQNSFSPQGRMLALMKLAEMLAAFNDPSFYRNYEDKDRHTALTTKVDEAVMEIARSLAPADLTEFNEAVAWQRTKLPMLAKAMQLNRDTDACAKLMSDRPRLETEYLERMGEWQAAKDKLNPQLAPLELELKVAQADPAKHGVLQGLSLALFVSIAGLAGLLLLCVGGAALTGQGHMGPRDGAAIAISLVVFVGFSVLALSVWVRPETKKAAYVADVNSRISTVMASLPPAPSLLPAPTQPADERCERFLSDEKLGSAFPELEATFTQKRALVERVLEADALLVTELTELDARALLHRTAQEVAAKMSLPLPPSISGPLAKTPAIKSRYAYIVTKKEGKRGLPSELDPDGEIIFYGDETHRCWDTLNRFTEHLQLTPLKQFEWDGEDDEEDAAPWHDPADGLRTVSGILQLIRQSTPEQLKPHFREIIVESVVFDLRAYETILRKAQQQDDPFRILVR